MLSFDFNFEPFDLTPCYQQSIDFYNLGWIDDKQLKQDVPAKELKKLMSDSDEDEKETK